MDEVTSDEDDTHFTLKKSIDPSKLTHLFQLKPKLTASNYATWTGVIMRSLQTVGLHNYLTADFVTPQGNSTATKHHPIRWQKANLFVCSVLIASMTEEIQNQIGHLPTAAKMWTEARRLYAGTTATDWTLTITSLVSTRYTDGEDLPAHISKMKGYRRDLIPMQRDIDDELFACFLRISMPSSWNYVFAALPDHYTSVEVERRIRDEYGVRTSQNTAISFQAVRSKTSKSGLSRTPIPGQPFCDNCNVSGHFTKDCYSPGGPMHGKRFGQNKSENNRGDGAKEDQSRGRSGAKDKAEPRPRSGKWANRAIADDESEPSDHEKPSDSNLSAYLTRKPSHSRFGWVLDSGSTNHICIERSAFTTFTPTRNKCTRIPEERRDSDLDDLD